MPYTPTDWVDGTTPVNAANLDKMETGIDQATDTAEAAQATANAAVPDVLTSRGDLIGSSSSGVPTRLPSSGVNGEVLTVDTPSTLGVKWATPPATGISATIVDAKGDLIAATAADTVARVPWGTQNQGLSVDGATATGMKWVDKVARAANGSVDVSPTDLAWTAGDCPVVFQNITPTGGVLRAIGKPTSTGTRLILRNAGASGFSAAHMLAGYSALTYAALHLNQVQDTWIPQYAVIEFVYDGTVWVEVGFTPPKKVSTQVILPTIALTSALVNNAWPDAATNYADFLWPVPSNYAGGDMLLNVFRRSPAGSGTAVFFRTIYRIRTGSAITVVATDVASDMVNPPGVTQVLGIAIAAANFTNGDSLRVTLRREGAHASDTYVSPVQLDGANVEYSGFPYL